MQKLYEVSVATASENAKLKGKKKPPPPPSSRMEALEKELREDLGDAKESQTNQAAGNAGAPTAKQASLLARYDPQDKDFNYYGNVVADYSHQLQQMREDYEFEATPLLLSTLNSQKDIDKMQENVGTSLFAMQFGHEQSEKKGYRNAKKVNKLSATNSWVWKKNWTNNKKKKIIFYSLKQKQKSTTKLHIWIMEGKQDNSEMGRQGALAINNLSYTFPIDASVSTKHASQTNFFAQTSYSPSDTMVATW